MPEEILLQLSGIVVLGILAQWLAWALRLPSILLLLIVGIIAGPVTGWLQPDKLFGNLMLPGVSLSVAIILYEGGLNLRFRELKEIGNVFFRLATIGAGLTWVIATVGAHFLLHFAWPIATLFGALLIVTGPTVIGPILRELRLRGKAGALLKWEGIILDPVGAMLAVLVFTAAQVGVDGASALNAMVGVARTLAIGGAVGVIAALFLLFALKRFWIPDVLHNPASLMLMFIALTSANTLQRESGLVAVTVMGIVLANQKKVSIHHVLAFKETLTILLIACLFIVLAARIPLEAVRSLSWGSLAFVALMIFVARPVSVLASTWRSTLSWQERCFLCFMAPRGIVAAAVSSVMALSLLAAGYSEATDFLPATFLLVALSVLIYGLGAAPLAHYLRLSYRNPQGVLFIGADPWVRELAVALQEEGCSVCLVDTDWENIGLSRMAGLPCIYGSALTESAREQIDFSGLGRVLAVTSNNEVNSLACLRYKEDFGRRETYQLIIPDAKKGLTEAIPLEHRGRLLFNPMLTFSELTKLLRDRRNIKKTRLTKEFAYEDFQRQHEHSAFPLFIVKSDGAVYVCTVDSLYEPVATDLVISLLVVDSNLS